MAKPKKSGTPPSRKRYDEEHPTISLRLDIETKKRLKEHLEETNCSPTDFIKDALGRDESMIEKRVEMVASTQVHASLEHRIRYVEDLVHQLFSMPVDTDEYPPFCPRCDGQYLSRCEGKETESTIAHPWVITWKCPKCGFFMDTYKRIDPKSIKWLELNSGKSADKPKTSARHRPKKH